MNRDELRTALNTDGVHPAVYNLDGRVSGDCVHILDKIDTGWTVFFLERGIRCAEATFSTETAACAEMWRRLDWCRRNAARQRATE